MARADDWSFIRNVLARGAAIHQDYTSGRFTENGSFSTTAAYERYSARMDAAARELADAYLAEHPADDGDLVTGEWLVAHGFDSADSFAWDLHPIRMEWFQGDTWEAVISNAVIVPDMGTRGAVRRLLACLGVQRAATEEGE